MDLSIIIITKDEEKALPRLLESIKQQDFKGYELIVSDANSKDKTRKIARQYNCRITEGGLPSKGRNNGAKIAKGKMLLFLDADIILPYSFLKASLQEIKKKNLDIAVPRLIPLSKKIGDKMLYSSYNLAAISTQYFFPHATGCCFFVKKNIFRKVKGFNEEIKIAEDHDFCRRSVKFGKFRILSMPVLSDTRRLEKEGRLKLLSKFLYVGVYRMVIGEMKQPPFSYNLQGVEIKRERSKR